MVAIEITGVKRSLFLCVRDNERTNYLPLLLNCIGTQRETLNCENGSSRRRSVAFPRRPHGRRCSRPVPSWLNLVSRSQTAFTRWKRSGYARLGRTTVVTHHLWHTWASWWIECRRHRSTPTSASKTVYCREVRKIMAANLPVIDIDGSHTERKRKMM